MSQLTYRGYVVRNPSVKGMYNIVFKELDLSISVSAQDVLRPYVATECIPHVHDAYMKRSEGGGALSGFDYLPQPHMVGLKRLRSELRFLGRSQDDIIDYVEVTIDV